MYSRTRRLAVPWWLHVISNPLRRVLVSAAGKGRPVPIKVPAAITNCARGRNEFFSARIDSGPPILSTESTKECSQYFAKSQADFKNCQGRPDRQDSSRHPG